MTKIIAADLPITANIYPIRELLTAFKEILGEIPDLRLLLTGKRDKKNDFSVWNFVDTYQLRSHVEFLPYYDICREFPIKKVDCHAWINRHVQSHQLNASYIRCLLQKGLTRSKIALFITSFHPGKPEGNSRVMRIWLDHLQNAGYRVHLLYYGYDFRHVTSAMRRDANRRFDVYLEVPVQSALVGHNLNALNVHVDDWCGPELLAAVETLTARYEYDVAIVNYCFMSAAFERIHAYTRKILLTHDSFADRNRKQLERGYPEAGWVSLDIRGERQACERADVVVALQSDEAAYFRALVRPGTEVAVVPPIIPRGPHRPARRAGKLKIGYFGSANWVNEHNLHDYLIAWLRQPILSDQSQLLIAGGLCQTLPAFVPVEIVAAAAPELLGYQDDLASFFRRCDVIVNPERGGTGIKIKTLEAMAASVPVLTTRHGAVGLDSSSRFHAATDAEELAELTAELLGDSDLLEQLRRETAEVYDRFVATHGHALAHLLGPTRSSDTAGHFGRPAIHDASGTAERVRLRAMQRQLFCACTMNKIWIVELALQHVYRIFLRSDSVVIDVGANTGLHARVLADIIDPAEGGRLILVEPIAEACRTLRADIAWAQVENLALSNKPGEATFYVCSGDSALSSLDAGWGHLAQRDDVEPRRIAVSTVDQLALGKVPRLDFIKINSEGSDGLVLLGAEKSLRLFRPIVSLELLFLPAGAGTTLRDLCEHHGYVALTLFGVPADVTEDVPYDERWDLLLVPTEKVPSVFGPGFSRQRMLQFLLDAAGPLAREAVDRQVLQQILELDGGRIAGELVGHRWAPSLLAQPASRARPKVSIVIPFFNVAAYFEACLTSVVDQDYDNLEVLLVDDASADDSLVIAEQFAAHDPRIVVLSHDRNRGLGSARNTGVAHATGSHVLFLDSDDLLSNRSAVSVLVQHSEATGCPVIVGSCEFLLPDGTVTAMDRAFDGTHQGRPGEMVDGLTAYLGASFIPDGQYVPMRSWGTLIDRITYDESGLQFPDCEHEDLAHTPFLYHFAGRVLYIEDTVVRYRQRPNSLSNSSWSAVKLRRYLSLWRQIDLNVTRFGLESQRGNTAIKTAEHLLMKIQDNGLESDAASELFKVLENILGSATGELNEPLLFATMDRLRFALRLNAGDLQHYLRLTGGIPQRYLANYYRKRLNERGLQCRMPSTTVVDPSTTRALP